MNLYKGKLVAEIVTVVNTNNEEKMTEYAHEGVTFELLEEIQTLLAANGYYTISVGAKLENEDNATNNQIEIIKRNEIDGIRKAKSLYNKANRVRLQVKID
ncbi:hypothetical protein QMK38_01155 [Lysinibacillus fusiformis]|nr:hypothetical protein [Lysinibacillus fusiformis]